jgi:hypothetical protein
MRAADTDRDRVVEFLNAAYIQGRLSEDERDARVNNALAARTYADLDQLTSDLPGANAVVAPPGVETTAPVTSVAPVAKTNGLATASLVCGIAQFAFGPLTTIPAIVFGHMARQQIKRTGEQGAGAALAGLMLGYAAVVVGIFVLVVGIAVATSSRVPMGVH